MAADLSALDLLVVQIDGIHIGDDLVLVAAIGVDGEGIKHPLGLMEGATENAAMVQALIDNLVARGFDPAVPRLFIIDGSKALSKAIRRSFGLVTFPPILWTMLRLPNLTLAASFLLYLAARHFDWNLAAFPTGYWYFNPFCWQFLFIFGGWCALGGLVKARPLIRSRALLWLGKKPRSRRSSRSQSMAGRSSSRTTVPAFRRRRSRASSTTASGYRRVKPTSARRAALKAMRSRPSCRWPTCSTSATATMPPARPLSKPHGVAHHIRFSVDHIRQEPQIEHATSAVDRRLRDEDHGQSASAVGRQLRRSTSSMETGTVFWNWPKATPGSIRT